MHIAPIDIVLARYGYPSEDCGIKVTCRNGKITILTTRWAIVDSLIINIDQDTLLDCKVYGVIDLSEYLV